jgi:hypothetical protein
MFVLSGGFGTVSCMWSAKSKEERPPATRVDTSKLVLYHCSTYVQQ